MYYPVTSSVDENGSLTSDITIGSDIPGGAQLIILTAYGHGYLVGGAGSAVLLSSGSDTAGNTYTIGGGSSFGPTVSFIGQGLTTPDIEVGMARLTVPAGGLPAGTVVTLTWTSSNPPTTFHRALAAIYYTEAGTLTGRVPSSPANGNFGFYWPSAGGSAAHDGCVFSTRFGYTSPQGATPGAGLNSSLSNAGGYLAWILWDGTYANLDPGGDSYTEIYDISSSIFRWIIAAAHLTASDPSNGYKCFHALPTSLGSASVAWQGARYTGTYVPTPSTDDLSWDRGIEGRIRLARVNTSAGTIPVNLYNDALPPTVASTVTPVSSNGKACSLRYRKSGILDLFTVEGNALKWYVSRDTGRTWGVATTVVGSGAAGVTHLLDGRTGKLLVAYYDTANTRWMLRVGTLSGGTWTFATATVLATSANNAGQLGQRRDGTFEFAYVTSGGAVSIIRCKKLKANGTGTWS